MALPKDNHWIHFRYRVALPNSVITPLLLSAILASGERKYHHYFHFLGRSAVKIVSRLALIPSLFHSFPQIELEAK